MPEPLAPDRPRHVLELGDPVGPVGTAGTVTWIGTATVVIDAGGFRILTDPNFLHRGQHVALGGGLRSKRLTEPALPLDRVLPVDLVVLSHHHGDHFDDVAARGLPDDTPIVTTRHAARKLAGQGFRRVLPLETWERAEVRRDGASVTITAVPAVHAPQPLRAVLPTVNGSVLDYAADGHRYRLYVTGDTLLTPDMAEIAQRFPGVDLALVHLGGTRILGILLTMDGEQGARAIELIDPTHAVPIHHGDYTVFRSPLSDFDEALARRPLRTVIHRLERGDAYTFDLHPPA